MKGNIINLVRRDFDALKSDRIMSNLSTALFTLSVIFASLVNDISLLPLFLFIYNYIQNLFSLDEKHPTEKYFASLPVRRSEIVLSRYLGVVVITAIYLLIAYLVNRGFIFFNFSLSVEARQPLPAGYIILVFLILAFLTSFTLPFYFRFGFSKSNGVSVILWMVLGALTLASFFDSDRSSLTDFIFCQEITGSIILFGSAVLLLAISVPLTVALYNKKDL
ncbi:MAG: ABC-2 transporter permease [Desulfatiglans sp.]|jgi:ABC-type transport system involved in multi-copper enzyme maturation permease subunit|nr:ABC-2 transporter permease [Desulfatiglans sp.]